MLPLGAVAQNTIALPHVTNYTKQSYSGGLQNWKIKQDKSGNIYIANNEGLISFDGTFWNLYPLPNKTVVRSLEISADGKIYTGGQDEIGYFLPNLQGSLTYVSILEKIPASYRSFGDVWEITELAGKLYFRTNKYIFEWDGKSISVKTAVQEWLFIGKWEDKLYAQDGTRGLFVAEANQWIPITTINAFSFYDPITSIVPVSSGRCFITTLKSGIFDFTNGKINNSNLQNQQIFKAERVYAAVSIGNAEVALATNSAGVLVIDSSGAIIQRLSTVEGLQNNNVLSIFSDRKGNLWLGLDNGIDLVAYNSAIKQINPLQKNASGYAAIVKDDQLYIGTSNGLYSTLLQPKKDLSFSLGNFKPVKNTKGQVWGLADIGRQLLMGHHEGAFRISNGDALPISNSIGFWNFRDATDHRIISGTYTGIDILSDNELQPGQVQHIPGFSESSRYLVLDSENNIWISHPYHGVFEITGLSEGKFIVKKFGETQGLPSLLNNHIFKIRNEIVAATVNGIYTYDKATGRFLQSAYYKSILGGQSIRYLKESPSGNIWFIHEKTIGVIDLSGKKPVIMPLPMLTNKMLSGFEFIYATDESNIFLGGERGFYHINYKKYLSEISPISAQVRSIHIIDKTDSLLFGGYFSELSKEQKQGNRVPVISHDWKSIQFSYSATDFGSSSELQYSIRLKGFDENWSDWSSRTNKEYTNLSGGTYVFEVKVRNNLNKESEVTNYKFKVLPPWYLTKLAIGIYFLSILLGLFLVYKFLKKKFRLQRQKYEEEQKRINYIHELEQNRTRSELITLQNEKLEADISFKNAELAAAAMHLVKKGELLTKIKDDLSHVSKEIRNPEAISAIKKMVKKVGEDDKLDEEWESFAKHFDSVHSDYLTNLKEKHPNLTGNELKLCANLRMNLSTKEIAQLMNISVRGVEVSRYRLRKKLELESGDNLFDYLMTIA